ncbi:ATP-grasp ribosomal peptide maturase [Embleya hyalina]|uniref:ATP-grasp ribosomal peptide maturase n=1 Tax=Embleya hyalina TaxID=516124 RepID=A0A401YTF8_9ACTN|nr:ATP-grasp ribosomal peptide maturase [Embleya hyalina]GCD97859.1 ATP-grasp ribosomal peptide maturase [Embleya hyalina]
MSTHSYGTGPCRPVLVCAPLGDRSADAVIEALGRREVPVARIDPGVDFPLGSTLSACFDPGRGMTGVLETTSRRVLLDAVRAVYHRQATDYGPAFTHLSDQDALFAVAQARHGLGGVLAALPCLHVNHPHAATAASYKPVGLAAALRVGLSVPPTLITSDPEAARAFAKRHGPIVYKVLRTVRYRDPDDRPLTVWTTAVDPDDIDDAVAGTAHLFQARVDAVADLRVTFVGGRMFVARIDSGLLDWRSDYDRHRYDVVDLPEPVAAAVTRYMRDQRLCYGALDLAVTSSGEHLFYECNPLGRYGWIEAATGMPISAAIADLLRNGSPP